MISGASIDSEAPEPPRVAAVIITHNRRSQLAECLDSLLKSTCALSDIVIVNNASTDDTVSYIAEHYPTVRVLSPGKNLLVSAAANLGMSHVAADYYLVIADDNIADPDMVRELLDTSLRLNAGISAPKMLFRQEPNRLWSMGATFSLKTGICRHRAAGELDHGQWDVVWEPDCVHNVLLIARRVIDKIGPFDQWNFPMQNEEADLCARAKRAGFVVLTVPTAKVWHDVETTTKVLQLGARDFTVNSPFRAYLTARSRTLIVRKHGTRVDKALYIAVFLLPITLAYLGIILLRPDRVAIARAYLSGTSDGVFGPVHPLSRTAWVTSKSDA